MSAKSWLRATGRDGNQHLLYYPELRLHVLGFSCSCRPRIVNGIVLHAVLTAAYVPQQKREREH